MRLLSYKITHDSGFAPNPFWGVLTLATCKPGIRRKGQPGDWIAGFTSRGLCRDPVGKERLLFLMKVEEKILYEQYFYDERFQCKIPDVSSSKGIVRCGDNIYQPLECNSIGQPEFRQLSNLNHDDNEKMRDISGRNALISSEFVYFGRNPMSIPQYVRPNVPSMQSPYGVETSDMGRAREFMQFVMDRATMGRVQAPPHNKWPDSDESWKESP